MDHTAWHLVTGEAPPQLGGLAGVTAALAKELRRQNKPTTVWHLTREELQPNADKAVRRVLGGFSRQGLARLDQALKAEAGSREILLQWLPHSFGPTTLAPALPRWMRRRRAAGDRVHLCAHEPYLPWLPRPRALVAGTLQRLLLARCLRAADRVWVTTTAWRARLQRWGPWDLEARWLPVTATLPSTSANADRSGGVTLGYLGLPSELAVRVLPEVCGRLGGELSRVVLAGVGTGLLAERVRNAAAPAVTVDVADSAADEELSRLLATCDIALLPFVDGLTTRRTSAMNVFAHQVALVSNRGPLTEAIWGMAGLPLASSATAVDLAEACRALIRDPGERAAVAEAGHRLYLAELSPERAVERLLSP